MFLTETPAFFVVLERYLCEVVKDIDFFLFYLYVFNRNAVLNGRVSGFAGLDKCPFALFCKGDG